MVKRRQVMRYSPSAGKHPPHRGACEEASLRAPPVSDASAVSWGTVVSHVQNQTHPKAHESANILYRCTETGKAHYAPWYAKKFELVDREVPIMTTNSP